MSSVSRHIGVHEPPSDVVGRHRAPAPTIRVESPQCDTTSDLFPLVVRRPAMISVSPEALAFVPPSVLVLEPDANVRHDYMGLLGGQFALTTVGSSDGAFAHLVRMRPAVVMTDVVLPDGDGIDVCRAAKSSENAPAVLIITADVERVPEAI